MQRWACAPGVRRWRSCCFSWSSRYSPFCCSRSRAGIRAFMNSRPTPTRQELPTPATLRAPWSSSTRTTQRRSLRILCTRLFPTRTRRRCCVLRGCKPNRPRRRNMSTLAGKKCRPLPAGTPALTRARIDALLAEVPGWTYDGKVIAKSWSFKNYYETLAFVNAVAWLVHREDHHPDMSVGYNRCRVEFSTHSIGGISENDFIF